MQGVVEAIHLTEKHAEPVKAVTEVNAVAGTGLEGDHRYQRAIEKPESVPARRHASFIEAEAIDALKLDCDIEFSAEESRRNICTRGIALNHLVGRKFRAGTALLRGAELCEPCDFMENLCGKKGVREALVHRGGLRAEILESGVIRVGDAIELCD